MDIDFALVLVSLTSFTGIFVLLDHFFFKKKRALSVQNYRQEVGEKVDWDVVRILEREPVWIEYPKSFFPVFLVVLLLRSFLVEPYTIPSGSMLPTLEVGDFILVNKFAYGLRLPVAGTKILPIDEPKRGDVMVFRYPEEPSKNFIKRVVGLPGDRVSYRGKILKINGVEVRNELLAELPPQFPRERLLREQLDQVSHEILVSLLHDIGAGEWVVPANSYFVLGDNRDSSKDSRFWGFVPDQNIVGRAFAVWMHMPNWVPTFRRNGWIQ